MKCTEENLKKYVVSNLYSAVEHEFRGVDYKCEIERQVKGLENLCESLGFYELEVICKMVGSLICNDSFDEARGVARTLKKAAGLV
ncbi:hypothetical protein [Thalassotalea profundi]|uniref:MafI family immunity protein n=1 Tax=Thalassotalea profundi TaxID=2036687 RepID=A0ABQ3IPD0_9GAMM|nr:hypothetical protein [Thalassotalea profundi]GHE87398.1 hypothetical protein GCM10011501_16060 [Thalassotalea profundi]